MEKYNRQGTATCAKFKKGIFDKMHSTYLSLPRCVILKPYPFNVDVIIEQPTAFRLFFHQYRNNDIVSTVTPNLSNLCQKYVEELAVHMFIVQRYKKVHLLRTFETVI